MNSSYSRNLSISSRLSNFLAYIVPRIIVWFGLVKIECHYAAQVGLELTILLLPPECWDYRPAPHPAQSPLLGTQTWEDIQFSYSAKWDLLLDNPRLTTSEASLLCPRVPGFFKPLRSRNQGKDSFFVEGRGKGR
jgi:hypothetical protein